MPSCPSALPAYAGAALTVGTVVATVGGCIGVEFLAERLLGLPPSAGLSRADHLAASNPEVAAWRASLRAHARRDASDASRIDADEDAYEYHVSHRVQVRVDVRHGER